MSRLGLILRWVGALLVGALVYVTVAGLVAVIGRQFGADPIGTIGCTINLATIAAVFGGTFIVPREQRKTAALIFWLLATAVPFWFVVQPALSGRFPLINFLLLFSAMIGGYVAYALVRSGLFDGRRINRDATSRPLSRKKLWSGILIVLFCVMFLAFLFRLNPDLARVLMQAFSLLVVGAIVVFLVWAKRVENKSWRGRKTRAPIEDAIHQSSSER
jgi:hypothetical protein